jgi:peptide/nickel transport system substrate-binding protein
MNILPTHRLFWLSSLCALIFTAFLVGCSFIADELPSITTQSPPTSTAAPSPTALPRGGNLTVRLAEDIPALRPWQPRSRGEEQVLSLLYSGLMQLDDRLRPQPDLAREWQASADGRVLTFTLNSDMAWHDGQPLNASDVKFTLDALRSLPMTSTALLAELHNIADVTAPTSSTVVLSLTERYAPLMAYLTVPILPRHLLAESDIADLDFWDVPIGSGPFRLADRIPDQSIVFSGYEHFHGGQPLLERVAFIVAPSPEVALSALSDEQLLLAEVPWSFERRISETLEKARLAHYPENGYYFLGFNLREGRPFADVRLRQALAQALDVPRLVEAVTKGQGMPIASSAVPGSWADLTQPADTADLEAARNLLEEAGWTLPAGSTIRQNEGVTLTAQLFVRGDDERRVAAAERIAETAASIGMQLDVQLADFETTLLSKYAPPYDFDLLLGSWLNGAGDPDFADFVYYDPDDFALFHSSQINQGPADERITRNFVAFDDSAYDNQAQAARQLYDLEARVAAYRQTQDRVTEQLPYLYLWADRIPVALNNDVTTLDGPVNLDSPLYFWNIERWYLSSNER